MGVAYLCYSFVYGGLGGAGVEGCWLRVWGLIRCVTFLPTSFGIKRTSRYFLIHPKQGGQEGSEEDGLKRLWTWWMTSCRKRQTRGLAHKYRHGRPHGMTTACVVAVVAVSFVRGVYVRAAGNLRCHYTSQACLWTLYLQHIVHTCWC